MPLLLLYDAVSFIFEGQISLSLCCGSGTIIIHHSESSRRLAFWVTALVVSEHASRRLVSMMFSYVFDVAMRSLSTVPTMWQPGNPSDVLLVEGC